MDTYRMTIAYDGTDYHGWQRQPDKRTIQGSLEAVLSKILKANIPVIGAGRTDAGVHARAQVAHFRTSLGLPLEALFRALNSLLPRDIRITKLSGAPKGFHARKSAVSKIYRYRILLSPRISPFDLRYVLHYPHPLNVTAFARAAGLFTREADFSAFSSNRLLHPVRNVKRSECTMRGGELVYTVEANGFLRYMVRTMVGALLEVGKGKLTAHDLEGLFDSGKRTELVPTAPAHGLCLIKVIYGDEKEGRVIQEKK